MCKGMPSNSPSGLASRLALDRFIMTPPFLVTTLAGLHFLQHLDPKGALKHMRMIFWGALVMNWKVRCDRMRPPLPHRSHTAPIPLPYRCHAAPTRQGSSSLT